MTLKLGSNIASLRTLRSLDKSSSLFEQSLSRLASGQRINRPSDDAAGLAIADSLGANARMYTQATRNINDGLSMLNIIDGALESQTSILTRLKELAQQSANGVFSNDQRGSISLEYRSLLQEFARIAETTKFNGKNLLSGENQELMQIMAGITSGDESLLSFLLPQSGLGYGTVGVRNDYNGDSNTDFLDVSDYNLLTSQPLSLEDFFSLVGFGVQTQTVIDSAGVERTVYITNVFQGFDGDSGGIQVFYENNNGLIESAGIADITAANMSANVALNFSDSGATGSLLVDFSSYTIVAEEDGPFQKSALDFTGIETSARALDALDVLSYRLEELSQIRGEIGATQSRLTIALNTTRASAVNAKEAEARIRDADVAAEFAQLIRQKILQQAATAVLAQANTQPSLALQLLR